MLMLLSRLKVALNCSAARTLQAFQLGIRSTKRRMAFKHSTEACLWPSTVACSQDFDPSGAPRPNGGLLTQTNQLMQQPGWWWQHDGARAHTLKNTVEGQATRALITQTTPNIIEDWPVMMDISPIEHAWERAECLAWTDFGGWTNQAEFEKAVRNAWGVVRTDTAYLRNLFSAVPRDLEKCRRLGGAYIGK